jgi:predicted RNase H-like nuclease (RuvC/YqgF family)
MHVENVRSVIEELEREYAILSDKLNEHEKQTDGIMNIRNIYFIINISLYLAIDRIINNLDRELKSKQKELEQLKVKFRKMLVYYFGFSCSRIRIKISMNVLMKKNVIQINMKLNYVMHKIRLGLLFVVIRIM